MPTAIPAGACDTHVHIFPARAIALAGAKVAPAEVKDYLRQRAALGFSRSVLVQPTAFRFDNSALLGALSELGGEARGVAIVAPDVPEATLEALSRGGVCGARLHLLKNPLQSWEDLPGIAARVERHGWHVQLQCDGRQLPDYRDRLERLPVPLVIDQTGKFIPPVEPEDPAFVALLSLLDTGRVYVKLSAPYEVSRSGPPSYQDVGRLARELVRRFPDRMLWASNWPHTFFPPESKPDDAALFGLLADWAPTQEVRQRILVDTPEQVYGFQPTKAAEDRPASPVSDPIGQGVVDSKASHPSNTY